jgi:hypothetical protein
VREIAVDGGAVNELTTPDGVQWLDATYRADGAIVVLADGSGDGYPDRLDVVDRTGRIQGSVPLPEGVDSLTASRCFRPDA